MRLVARGQPALDCETKTFYYETHTFCYPTGRTAVSPVNVRYIVDDVDGALVFYRELLGFDVEMHPAPGFAMLRRGGLRLLLNAPGAGGAGQAADDVMPEPGGWNRFQLTEHDLDAAVERLLEAGAQFRSGIVDGQGGRQTLVEDPAGNVVELFEPAER